MLKNDTRQTQHNFAQVPVVSKPRSSFKRSSKYGGTQKFDYSYPIYTDTDMLPGDTCQIGISFFARLQTQVTYLLDQIYTDMHAFFVPYRIIHDNSERLIANAQPGGPGQDNSGLETPNIDLTELGVNGYASGSLFDHLDYPTLVNYTTAVGAIAHQNNYAGRAYNKIKFDWYYDQNLQNPPILDTDDGPDDPNNYPLWKDRKRYDYFTSCLPFLQKGTASAVTLDGSLSVVTNNTVPNFSDAAAAAFTNRTFQVVGAGSNHTEIGGAGIAAATTLKFGSNTGLQAQPSGSNQLTFLINNFRRAYSVQLLLEADARGGTRYVESILHRWGVVVPDFRLQRAEYLGGVTLDMRGQIVPQTSETGTTPQGNLAQYSAVAGQLNFTYSVPEHGVIMVLCRHRANITYQQGMKRSYTRRTRFDFYTPEFAHLGEQAVLNSEIYSDGSAADNQVFGYQEYAAEYRYTPSRIRGEMRSNFPQSLDSRHLADDYSSLPVLNSSWIESDTPIDRNITVDQSVQDPISYDMFVSEKITRVMPVNSIPGLGLRI